MTTKTHGARSGFQRAMSGDGLAGSVEANVAREFLAMRGVLGELGDDALFTSMEENTFSILRQIEHLTRMGRIMPRLKLRLSPGSPPMPIMPRRLRIGVFPIAANPLHWMHLFGGLAAMAQFELDKVIFVIAGSDQRKPFMSPEGPRHEMARRVLRLFLPLFEYSPISRGSGVPGEQSLFRLMALNPNQPLSAFYIAGGDHYRRFAPQTGEPDTISRLEEGIAGGLHGYDAGVHEISAVFLQRKTHRKEKDIRTFLDVSWIGQLPVEASSTAIREALNGRRPMETLALLPFTAFECILATRLYLPMLEGDSVTGERSGMDRRADRARRIDECARLLRSLGESYSLSA